jgi:hypothetical protein
VLIDTSYRRARGGEVQRATRAVASSLWNEVRPGNDSTLALKAKINHVNVHSLDYCC